MIWNCNRIGPSTIATRLLIVAVGLAGTSVARADEKTYEKAIHSAAWVISPMQRDQWDGMCSFGTAVVEDASSRVLITAYHVVGDRDQVLVFFPQFDAQGQAITRTSAYLEKRSTLGIEGKVVWRSPEKDLALIALPRIPAGVVAVNCATVPPKPGQMVYAIGNSGFSDEVLWRLSSGVIRQVLPDYSFSMAVHGNDTASTQVVHGALLETQLAINEGDSGGPAFNEAGELVGICSSMDPRQTLVSYVISFEEVKTAMGAYELDEFMKRPRPKLDLSHLDWPKTSPFHLPLAKMWEQQARQQQEEARARAEKIVFGVIAGIVVLRCLGKGLRNK